MNRLALLTQNWGEVLHVMQQLAEEGMTMVVVTHEMQFAREVAIGDISDKGCVAEEGIARQVITNPTRSSPGFLESYECCGP